MFKADQATRGQKKIEQKATKLEQKNILIISFIHANKILAQPFPETESIFFFFLKFKKKITNNKKAKDEMQWYTSQW